MDEPKLAIPLNGDKLHGHVAAQAHFMYNAWTGKPRVQPAWTCYLSHSILQAIQHRAGQNSLGHISWAATYHAIWLYPLDSPSMHSSLLRRHVTQGALVASTTTCNSGPYKNNMLDIQGLSSAGKLMQTGA
jgi:hypothetical protein